MEKPEPGVPYSVYHSALIYLIGPDRKLADVCDYQMGPEGLTQELDRVLGKPAKASGKKHDASRPGADKTGNHAPAKGAAPAKSDAPAKADEASGVPAGETSASASGLGSARVRVQPSV